MAKTGAIRAGRAFVELFADNSKLVRGLKWAEARLKAFGRSVQTIGRRMMALSAAIVTPLIGSAKVFSRVGDQVAKMSKRTGVSVETLSELRYVASQTGTEFESLEMAFRKMQRSIYDAGRGLSTAVDALDDLGLRFEDLDGLTPEAQFKRLADRIGQLEDPTKKAAIAMSLFGRTGTNLLPMFAVGSRGIEQLQKKARDLGLTISNQDAKAAEDFTDAMDSLWKVLKQGTFLLGAALASDLQAAAEWLTRAAVNTSTWIKENKKLVSNLFRVTVGIGAAGAALVVLGTAIQGLVKPLALIGIGKVVGIGGLVIALGAIATKTEAGGIPFILPMDERRWTTDAQFVSRLSSVVHQVFKYVNASFKTPKSVISTACSRWPRAVYGLKSAGLKARTFFGSRLTLAIRARIADVWDQRSRPQASAIQSNCLSVRGPGSTPATAASS